MTRRPAPVRRPAPPSKPPGGNQRPTAGDSRAAHGAGVAQPLSGRARRGRLLLQPLPTQGHQIGDLLGGKVLHSHQPGPLQHLVTETPGHRLPMFQRRTVGTPGPLCGSARISAVHQPRERWNRDHEPDVVGALGVAQRTSGGPRGRFVSPPDVRGRCRRPGRGARLGVRRRPARPLE